MNNKLYDTLKFISLICVDVLAAFVLNFGETWGIAHTNEIASTITEIGVLIGAIVATASSVYHKKNGGDGDV